MTKNFTLLPLLVIIIIILIFSIIIYRVFSLIKKLIKVSTNNIYSLIAFIIILCIRTIFILMSDTLGIRFIMLFISPSLHLVTYIIRLNLSGIKNTSHSLDKTFYIGLIICFICSLISINGGITTFIALNILPKNNIRPTDVDNILKACDVDVKLFCTAEEAKAYFERNNSRLEELYLDKKSTINDMRNTTESNGCTLELLNNRVRVISCRPGLNVQEIEDSLNNNFIKLKHNEYNMEHDKLHSSAILSKQIYKNPEFKPVFEKQRNILAKQKHNIAVAIYKNSELSKVIESEK